MTSPEVLNPLARSKHSSTSGQLLFPAAAAAPSTLLLLLSSLLFASSAAAANASLRLAISARISARRSFRLCLCCCSFWRVLTCAPLLPQPPQPPPPPHPAGTAPSTAVSTRTPLRTRFLAALTARATHDSPQPPQPSQPLDAVVDAHGRAGSRTQPAQHRPAHTRRCDHSCPPVLLTSAPHLGHSPLLRGRFWYVLTVGRHRRQQQKTK